MRDTIDMAREAGATPYTNRHYPDRPTHTFNPEQLERFADLVRADERNRVWTQEHWTEYERSIAAAEREAMVTEAAKTGRAIIEDCVRGIAAIRAKGNT
jgi:hypothetical protein